MTPCYLQRHPAVDPEQSVLPACHPAVALLPAVHRVPPLPRHHVLLHLLPHLRPGRSTGVISNTPMSKRRIWKVVVLGPFLKRFGWFILSCSSPNIRVKEVNTKEVRDIDWFIATKLLRRFTTVRVGRFLPQVFPDFPPATEPPFYCWPHSLHLQLTILDIMDCWKHLTRGLFPVFLSAPNYGSDTSSSFYTNTFAPFVFMFFFIKDSFSRYLKIIFFDLSTFLDRFTVWLFL